MADSLETGMLEPGYIILIILLVAVTVLCIYRLYLQRLASPFENAAGLEELLMEQGRASASSEYLPPAVIDEQEDVHVSLTSIKSRSDRGRSQSQVWQREKADAKATIERMEAEEVRFRKSLIEETIVLEEEEELIINKRIEALQQETGVEDVLGLQPFAKGTPAKAPSQDEWGAKETPVAGMSDASTPASDSNVTPATKLSDLYADATTVLADTPSETPAGNGKKKKKKKKKGNGGGGTPSTPSTKLGALYDEA